MGRHIPYNGGRAKTLEQTPWKLHILISKDNTALGIYGWDMRKEAVKQLQRIAKHNPHSHARIIERTFPFEQRPKVGDQIQ
jgi:hypothetical protein